MTQILALILQHDVRSSSFFFFSMRQSNSYSNLIERYYDTTAQHRTLACTLPNLAKEELDFSPRSGE